jgi:hypothetical protein
LACPLTTMISMNLGGEGQRFCQSPHLARHDVTRRSGLSATEHDWGRGRAFNIGAPNRLRLPPALKVRSPQRIVSLQYLYGQIELQFLRIEARCGATDTILRAPYKAWLK